VVRSHTREARPKIRAERHPIRAERHPATAPAGAVSIKFHELTWSELGLSSWNLSETAPGVAGAGVV